MPLILGVDPGASGALALVDTAAQAIIGVLDVPTLKLNGWGLVDGAAVSDWLSRQRFDLAVLEKVDARPTDGRGSIAQFARNCGGLGTLLVATGKPLALTTPRAWKERAGLVDQPKAASLELAKLTFGADAAGRWFPLKRHHDRAEAALLALYGGRPP
jgi:crossover junction endodeoxyribonuclease RuvC